MVVALYGFDGMAGRFGMTLGQAKDYFLAKAKEMGLEPIKVKESEDKVYISFYHPAMQKPAGWRMPWDQLRNLAYEFQVPFDYDADPPWDYTLRVEKTPPEGEYVAV